MEKRIGIRREDKNPWERRVPLTPKHVFNLKTMHRIQTVIQPSSIRIFKDEEYVKAGAVVQEDLSSCSVVLGVKEMPHSFFLPSKFYLFFSHTTKGQSQNMPMLGRLAELGCTLLDYEKAVDRTGRRILFFGRYAGLAGMIDTLWALGRRLEWEGIRTPLQRMKPTHQYRSLAEAKSAVLEIGQLIRQYGLSSLHPLVIGFSGYGHVSSGAQEIFNLLPHRELPPSQLTEWESIEKGPPNELIKVVFHEEDLMRRRDDRRPFDLQEYYDHPDQYESRFEFFLPYLTALVNAIYWSPRYPRLVTRTALKKLYDLHHPPRLRVIGDITCDIEGSIECTLRSTQPDDPVFVYDPFSHTVQSGVEGNGPVVLAVDNLPCELPRASSRYFGNALMPYLPEIAGVRLDADFENCRLSPEIKGAIILYKGRFTPPYRYMESFIQ
ncbi:MAG TPA: hypothetical protein ENN03_09040 [bacterium]|nr:hypothetical protein [bacterium]